MGSADHVDASRGDPMTILLFFSLYYTRPSSVGWGGGCAARFSLLANFVTQIASGIAYHVKYFGLATNTQNVKNNSNSPACGHKELRRPMGHNTPVLSTCLLHRNSLC